MVLTGSISSNTWFRWRCDNGTPTTWQKEHHSLDRHIHIWWDWWSPEIQQRWGGHHLGVQHVLEFHQGHLGNRPLKWPAAGRLSQCWTSQNWTLPAYWVPWLWTAPKVRSLLSCLHWVELHLQKLLSRTLWRDTAHKPPEHRVNPTTGHVIFACWESRIARALPCYYPRVKSKKGLIALLKPLAIRIIQHLSGRLILSPY